MTVIYQVRTNHPIFGDDLIYTPDQADAERIAQEWRDRGATAEVDPIDEDVLNLLNYLVPLGTPVPPMTKPEFNSYNDEFE
jgi:hypothetical protein